jgi:hypothetical protein
MSRASAQLEFIEPQLSNLNDEPVEGSDWIHEHDGYRMLEARLILR